MASAEGRSLGSRPPYRTLAFAGPEDSEGVRRLLRETPVGGEILLSFERGPMDGPTSCETRRTVVARDAGGRIIAMGARSVRPAYVNGRPALLGYLGELRVAAGRGLGRRSIAEGFRLLRGARGPDEALFDTTAIPVENRASRRLLEAGLPGLPEYRARDVFVTLIIPALRSRGPKRRMRIVRATTDLAGGLADCIGRHSRRRQFAPIHSGSFPASYDADSATSLPDIRVALEGSVVVGCAGCWDRRKMRTFTVMGYGPRLKLLRPFLNLSARLCGGPTFPPPGSALGILFASPLAVEDDNGDVACALLEAVRSDASSRGASFLVVGFSERDPLLTPVRRRFSHRAYESILYTVHDGPDGSETGLLDDRPAGPDAALL